MKGSKCLKGLKMFKMFEGLEGFETAKGTKFFAKGARFYN
jgi:hypothetical protein